MNVRGVAASFLIFFIQVLAGVGAGGELTYNTTLNDQQWPVIFRVL